MKNLILSEEPSINNSSPQLKTLNTNSEIRKSCSCSISTIVMGESIIIVPKPIRASGPQWMNYVQACSESRREVVEGNKEMKEKTKSEAKITKEERISKVQRFLEKRRKRNGIKKIRYQYRQQVAARRIRYHGRFIKIEQAKELILKGELVDANDKTELNKLFEELKENNVLDETLQQQKAKIDNKSNLDTIPTINIASMRKFSTSTNGGTNSRTSPLIQIMKEDSRELKQQSSDIKVSPPVLKL